RAPPGSDRLGLGEGLLAGHAVHVVNVLGVIAHRLDELVVGIGDELPTAVTAGFLLHRVLLDDGVDFILHPEPSALALVWRNLAAHLPGGRSPDRIRRPAGPRVGPARAPGPASVRAPGQPPRPRPS